MRRPTLFLFLTAVLAGCPSDYKLDDADDPLPVLTLDECATTGDQHVTELAALGCTVTWGVDIAEDVSGNVNAVGFGIGILAEGEWDGGGSCDLTIECPVTPCLSEFIVCVEEYGDTEFCSDEVAECDLREFCQADKDDCDEEAADVLDRCLLVDDIERCTDLYNEMTWQCYCIYDLCTDDEWDDACEEDESAPALPPPPVQLAPTTWRVTRRLIDAELGRLSDLDVQTPLWPVYNPATSSWRGARLGFVHKDSTLFALGLRKGDLLRTANGIVITNALVQPAILLPLRNANQVRLVIERAGTSKELLYKIVP